MGLERLARPELRATTLSSELRTRLSRSPVLTEAELSITTDKWADPMWLNQEITLAQQGLDLSYRPRLLTKPEQAEFLSLLPFTPAATQWFLQTTIIILGNGATIDGGGRWSRGGRALWLRSIQLEAAIHEASHAWIEAQVKNDPTLSDMLLVAVQEWATTWYGWFAFWWHQDKRRAWELARGYVYGQKREDGSWFPGFYNPTVEGNPNWTEMFAGFASGTGGNLSIMPDSLRPFYEGLFDARAYRPPAYEEDM